jgi:hypothetical protein
MKKKVSQQVVLEITRTLVENEKCAASRKIIPKKKSFKIKKKKNG